MLSVEEVKTRLRPVFESNGTRKAILFGSIAKGTQSFGSDVDILVDSGLHGLRFFGLLEDVCNALGVPVDLIDERQLKRESGMRREIDRTGVIIYERP